MADCVIVQPICPIGVAKLHDAGYSVFEAPTPDLDSMRDELAKALCVITRNAGFSDAQLRAAPHLRVIGVHGTGMDRIDLHEVQTRGIRVVNTPGTNARSVAEHALSLMLALSKSLPASDSAVRAGAFDFRERANVIELGERRLGLVGWGRVAQELAALAQALGMRVSVVSAHADEAALVSRGVHKVGTLDDLCSESDVLSLHTVPQNSPLIDARRLGLMPKGAFLINTARAALVDNAALAETLRTGHLGGAGIDVFAPEPPDRNDPLLGECHNLILTPHIAGSSRQALQRTALEVAQKVLVALNEQRSPYQ